jgi:hypothetical protein
LTTFDVPGPTNTTIPVGISQEGEIAGTYLDSNNVTHGFLRYRDGTFTTFDVPDAASTFPKAINSKGEIIGYWLDANDVTHDFLRTRDGTITTFVPPGSSGGSVAFGIKL